MFVPLPMEIFQVPTRVVILHEGIEWTRQIEAVAALPSPIHLGWKGFMTDHGELWLDGVVWTHVYRVRSVCGGP